MPKLSFGNPAALAALARGDVLNAALAATPGGIEAQEKAGQEMLVSSQLLPVEMKPCRGDFEALGFVFGKQVDDLFLAAELPLGWRKVATGHDMWSDILDEHGTRRVGIFYKAAFYDRRADMALLKEEA